MQCRAISIYYVRVRFVDASGVEGRNIFTQFEWSCRLCQLTYCALHSNAYIAAISRTVSPSNRKSQTRFTRFRLGSTRRQQAVGWDFFLCVARSSSSKLETPTVRVAFAHKRRWPQVQVCVLAVQVSRFNAIFRAVTSGLCNVPGGG